MTSSLLLSSAVMKGSLRVANSNREVPKMEALPLEVVFPDVENLARVSLVADVPCTTASEQGRQRASDSLFNGMKFVNANFRCWRERTDAIVIAMMVRVGVELV